MKQGSLPRQGLQIDPIQASRAHRNKRKSSDEGILASFTFTFFTSQDFFFGFRFPSQTCLGYASSPLFERVNPSRSALFQDLKKLFCLSIPRYLLHGAEMCSFALMINMIVMLMVHGLSDSSGYRCSLHQFTIVYHLEEALTRLNGSRMQ